MNSTVDSDTVTVTAVFSMVITAVMGKFFLGVGMVRDGDHWCGDGEEMGTGGVGSRWGWKQDL